MTEAEWLAGNHPKPMLEFVRSKISERKLRLFAVACCRRIWHLIDDEGSRRAVAVSERDADGDAGAEELEAASIEARAAVEQARSRRTSLEPAHQNARQAAAYALFNSARAAQRRAARAIEWEAAAAVEGSARRQLLTGWRQLSTLLPAALVPAAWQSMALPAWKAVERDEQQVRRARAAAAAVEHQAQADLLRELVGNPLRPACAETSWLRSNGGAVVRIARAIYDESRFGDLPILADALEEAGCTDADILAHCREGQEHTRGCWLLDSLLDLN